MSVVSKICSAAICGFTSALTGVRALWMTPPLQPKPRVYFANHSSHGDFVLVWAALPSELRKTTRPVAGADYWLKGRMRSYVGQKVFRAVLIDRNNTTAEDPIARMSDVLIQGESLIVFPEGTRNTTEEILLPFKSGIFRVATQVPETEFVPVWIHNINRVLPKGYLLPVPLLCTVSIGPALTLQPGEDKTAFLARTRAALLALAPQELNT